MKRLRHLQPQALVSAQRIFNSKCGFTWKSRDAISKPCALLRWSSETNSLPRSSWDGVRVCGVFENRGLEHSTLNSRILKRRTPKQGIPNFRKLPGEPPLRKPSLRNKERFEELF